MPIGKRKLGIRAMYVAHNWFYRCESTNHRKIGSRRSSILPRMLRFFLKFIIGNAFDFIFYLLAYKIWFGTGSYLLSCLLRIGLIGPIRRELLSSFCGKQ